MKGRGDKEGNRTERAFCKPSEGLLNIQLTTDQHMHEKKLSKAGKGPLERIRAQTHTASYCLFTPARKNLGGTGHWVEYSARSSPVVRNY